MVLNFELMLLPKRPSDVIKTTAIKAAIRPYSIAVAPDSFLRILFKSFFMFESSSSFNKAKES
ncbi:MAG: hypothetical protein RL186_58 [Pseudomonadota bacterium]